MPQALVFEGEPHVSIQACPLLGTHKTRGRWSLAPLRLLPPEGGHSRSRCRNVWGRARECSRGGNWGQALQHKLVLIYRPFSNTDRSNTERSQHKRSKVWGRSRVCRRGGNWGQALQLDDSCYRSIIARCPHTFSCFHLFFHTFIFHLHTFFPVFRCCVSFRVGRFARERWWQLWQCRGVPPAQLEAFAAALPRRIGVSST